MYVLDSEGRPIPSATITLRESGTTTNITETIFANDDPDTSQLVNGAFFTGADGKTVFYLTNQKRLDMLATKAGYSAVTIPVDVQKSSLVSGYATIQDEGVALAQQPILNITGAGATATNDATNGRTNLAITGATLADAAPPAIAAAGSIGVSTDAAREDHTHSGSAYQALSGLAFARKTVDESITSSTATQDDDHLSIAVGANETWEADFELYCSAGSSTPDINISFNAPTGAAGRWGVTGPDPAATTSIVQTVFRSSAVFGTGAGFDFGLTTAVAPIRATVLIRNGATAGNLTLRWAQSVSDAAAITIHVDSYVKARKVS